MGCAGYVQCTGGVSADATDEAYFPGRAPAGLTFGAGALGMRTWARPELAVVHVFNDAYWGNLQYSVR